ncbi:DsbA family protein [Aminobacter ciceronei]|uniref:Protein-disulfide isomerase n=1 Tax=Aminobacter ciceronei TaxID=150723 RepID=A0ABR6C0D2_9HYPH|nr:DsbA family protein [Aminobacter ciceronei]MBA8905017.1 protein-disulfide isomerase [Aminobacter ciceronei]MBA9018428.1 protein-disulfide isomerase [Aminobacter ciceronei]
MTENRQRSSTVTWLLFTIAVVGAAWAWFALDPGFRSPQESAADNIVSQAAFDQRLRDYLLANPEVIVQSMQGLEARQREAEATEAQAALSARANEVFRDPDSPVGGNPQGDVTMVEFFDYNCPYCRQVAPVMREAESGDPQLRIVYKEFPILGPGSVFAAKAALAAHRQGQYTAFHIALMQAKGKVGEATVLQAAAEVGLDVDRLRKDMDDPKVQAAIDRNVGLAQSLRINGTPGFVIGDQVLRGATDLATMKTLIAQARATTDTPLAQEGKN